MGCPFGPTTITAVDVPADEGFWASTATGQMVWVQLVGTGASPEDIRAGSVLIVDGTAAGDDRVKAVGFVL